jgi:polysaccharide pyruvyl transferase WcaK-like protein
MHCLVSGLQEAGYEIVSRTAIGYGYSHFQDVLEEIPLSNLRDKLAYRLNHSGKLRNLGRWIFGDSEPPIYRVSPLAWRDSVENIEGDLADITHGADWLVINGEGTIHDDSIGALTLIGLSAAARQLGMKTAIVNCSIFNLDTILMNELKKVNYIAVREPLSWAYLSEHDVKAYQAADCLFLSGKYARKGNGISRLRSNMQKKYIVYTPGVLSASQRFDKARMIAEITSFIDQGYTVYYYVVEIEDEKYVKDAECVGAVTIPLQTIDWRELADFLSRAAFVVSGRYHILIYAYLAGVQFMPLLSNTPKIAGLLDLLEVHIACSSSNTMPVIGLFSTSHLQSIVPIQSLELLARSNFSLKLAGY